MSNIIKKISEKKPLGVDYKYEDSYIAIESEIDKVMSASAVGEVDWNFIRDESEKILQQKSKDLKIASYWLYAQWKLSSWQGLESSLAIYIELLNTYQLEMFPKSKKVKLRILEWLQESLSLPILQNISLQDEEQVDLLVTNFELLETNLKEIFKEESLSIFSSLIRKIKQKIKEKELLKETVEVKEVIEEKKEEKREDKRLISYDVPLHIQKIQEELRGYSAIENENYILFNHSLLLGFQKLLVAFSKKEVLERSLFPNDKELDILNNIEDKKELLMVIKNYLFQYSSWLEGYCQLLNLIELESIKEHNKIYINTLKYNLISILSNNHKNLQQYTPDTYNILNENVKKWINLEKNSLTLNNIENKFEEEYTKAKAFLSQKKKREAIEVLDTMYQNSKSHEESFLWRLKQVEISMEMGNNNMATAFLYDLNNKIEQFNIEDWRSDLAIKVYIFFLKPSITKSLNSETKELFYRKLCRLSPKDANEVGFL